MVTSSTYLRLHYTTLAGLVATLKARLQMRCCSFSPDARSDLAVIADLAAERSAASARRSLSAAGGLDRKPHIHGPNTIVTTPHKAYGTSTNDMILQLRRYRIEKLILAGPVGNLCVEAHMRDFIEHGFEVAMVRDATAGTENEEGDGYKAALTKWRFLAHALSGTADAVRLIKGAASNRAAAAA